MTTHTSSVSPRILLWLIAVVLWTVACGPGPKSQALISLEKQYLDKVKLGQIREASPPLASSLESHYKDAIRLWENGDDEESLRVAENGMLYLRAAEMQRKAFEEDKRRAEAEAQIKSYNARIDKAKKDHDAMESAVAALENKLKTGRQLGVAEQLIVSSEALMAKAEEMGGKERATVPFTQGQTKLDLARKRLKAGDPDGARTLAEEAKVSFEQAIAVLKPYFELESKARRLFQTDVHKEARGVVVVIPRLFRKKKSRIEKSKQFLVDQAVSLAIEHKTLLILIEGHTQSAGGTSSNIKLGKKRAEAVKKVMVQAGVDPARVSVEGVGEDQPRFDNKDRDERGKNDRVEIIFTAPRM